MMMVYISMTICISEIARLSCSIWTVFEVKGFQLESGKHKMLSQLRFQYVFQFDDFRVYLFATQKQLILQTAGACCC